MRQLGWNGFRRARMVAFAVMTIAFAYGAGQPGGLSLAYLQGDVLAAQGLSYEMQNASGATAWRMPEPSYQWAEYERFIVPVPDEIEEPEFEL